MIPSCVGSPNVAEPDATSSTRRNAAHRNQAPCSRMARGRRGHVRPRLGARPPAPPARRHSAPYEVVLALSAWAWSARPPPRTPLPATRRAPLSTTAAPARRLFPELASEIVALKDIIRARNRRRRELRATLAEREATVEALLRLRRGEDADPAPLFARARSGQRAPAWPRLKRYFNE